MANITTGNPWVLDTAATITTTPIRVRRIRWTPTTDGDDLLLKDNGGNTIWSLKAIAADTNQGISYTLELGGSLNGLVITTMDHGTLYVDLY